jgi:hypothetical protein
MAKKKLNRSEVEQGIYIDFEGTQKDPPVMLGVHWVTRDGQEHMEQLVFDPRLESASSAKALDTSHGACVFMDSIEDAFKRVVELSEGIGAPILAWSIREEEVLASCDISQAVRMRVEARIVNALPIARRWVRREYGAKKLVPDKRGKRYTLPNFAKLTGYETPALYGSGNSAARVREVLRQIEFRGDFNSITGVAKRKWHSFLKHNEHDLCATRHVMLQVVPPAPDPESRRRGRRTREFMYETDPAPEMSCPDCGGVLSQYVYGMTRGLPSGQISGGCIIWKGKPDYRCDYCWEDFVTVRDSRPRRITRRDRCVQMVTEWGWNRKSVATNQGVPIEIVEGWLSEAVLTWD